MTTIDNGKRIELPVTAEECLETARAVLKRHSGLLATCSANYTRLQLTEFGIVACAFSVMQKHYSNRSKLPHGVKGAIVALCEAEGLSRSVAIRNVTWANHILLGDAGIAEVSKAAKADKPQAVVDALASANIRDVKAIGEHVLASLTAAGKAPKAKPVPTSAQKIARAIRAVDAEQLKSWRVLRDAIIEAGGEPLLANLIRNCTKSPAKAVAKADPKAFEPNH
jgi:hypothetical protein